MTADKAEQERAREVDGPLKESENLFRRVFEEGPLGIALTGPDFRFIEVNTAFCRMLGYSEEELISRTFADITHPEHVNTDVANVKKVYAGEIPQYHTQKRYIRKDGTIIWGDVTVSAIRDSNRKFQYCLALIENITQRKEAENTLQLSEQRYREVFEQTSDAIFLVDVLPDNRFKFISYNPVAGEIIRPPVMSDITGTLVEECFSKEIAANLINTYRRCVTAGVSISYEESFSTPDGERYFNTTLIPLKDTSGQVYRIIGIAHEITERKRMFDQLQAEKNKLQTFIDAMDCGVTIQDPDFNIIFQNEFMIKQFGNGLGRKCFEVYPREKRRCLGCPVKMCLKDGKTHIKQRTLLTPSGKTLCFENIASPIKDTNGKAIFHLELIRDITERKLLEEQLVKEQQDYKLIINSSPIIVFYKDKKGRFLRVNRAFAEVLGIPEEKFLGKTVFDLYSTKIAQDMTNDDQEVITSGRPKLGIMEQYESARGTMWVQTDKVPIFDANGLIIGLIGFSQDITERKKAEEDLKESEAFNSRLLDSSPNPIMVTNLDSSIRYANPATESLTGYTSAELIGLKAPYPWWPPEKHDEYKNNGPSRRYAEYFSQERYHRKKNGEIFWVALNIRRIIDKGEAKYYLASWVDITERKKAEEQVKYQAMLVDNVSDAVIASDTDLKIISWNKAAETIYGWKEEEVIGKDLREVAKMKFSGESLKEVVQKLDKDGHWRGESIQKRKNGTSIYISGSVSLLRDSSGKPIGTVALNRDITDSKMAEEEIKHAAEEWRTTFDSITDLVYILDNETRIIRMNRAYANLFKMRPKELLGKHCYEIFHGQKEPPPYCPHKKTAKTRKLAIAEYFEPLLGIYVEESASPMLDEKGEIIGTVNVLRDVTEQKNMEAKALETETLNKLNKAKSELLANVSHELRTPLASIKGFIETLIEPDVKWSKKEQLDFLRSADKEADHLTFLIRDLLDMSRLDSGKMVLDKRSYRVSEILDSAKTVLSVITGKHKLRIKLAPDLSPVQADKVRIAQVITNLVENAAKFSPEGTPILIEARMSKGNVIISVKDKGEGISEEALGNLFNRFYQAERVVSGKTRGTGLGLAICKGIIEAHGGKIWVESQTGQGSKFSFSIPVNTQ